MLAAFLAEAGVVVSADRLVEAIWPDGTAPEGARRTAMSYVSRLRAAIGPEHLVTRDNGYVLELDGAAYDAALFEAGLAEARRLGGDDAVAAYDAALALWTGRAFGVDGDESWLRPVAARLDELRLLASEERAEHLIDCSRHAEAVADLERLVTEQPLRERFVDLLMRALYLAGRQAEALRAFRRYHDYLAEETGLPPSDGLIDLERRITVGDPSLAPAAGEAVPGYELAEVIGEGAFGAVYRAVQPSVGREVAVKVVRPELADDPRFVQRFEAEAQLVARIEHPHVVPLYDYWRRPGGAFLVFRLLRGGSLADREADGSLGLGDVTRLVEEIGGALGGGARPGGRPPRREARQHPLRRDRQQLSGRLRDRQAGWRRRRTRPALGRVAALRQPGADPRRHRLTGVGSVRPRRRCLGGALRPGTLRGLERVRDRAGEVRRRRAPPRRRGRCRRHRSGLGEGHGSPPLGPVRVGRRARDGLAPGHGRARPRPHDR